MRNSTEFDGFLLMVTLEIF